MKDGVLILGANSDVAKSCIKMYVQNGFYVIAASRNLNELNDFVEKNFLNKNVDVVPFDAIDFATHRSFYSNLRFKPAIVVYAAGFLVDNEKALSDWDGTYQMINVHYAGAVSILNIIVMDKSNSHLRQIIGLSSLSGVRGRKSNFIYGSTKSAFTQYLAGLRQYLLPRKIRVHVIVAGYIGSKMTAGLELTEWLMLEPSFIAKAVISAQNKLIIVPGIKWKIIYNILRLLPERLAAKLP